jgi:hypothetical protein
MGKGPEGAFLKRKQASAEQVYKVLSIIGHQGDEIKTTMTYHLTLVSTAISNRQKKCWQGRGGNQIVEHCGRNVKLVQPLWKNSIKIPQNVNNSNPTTGYISKGNGIHMSKRHLHSCVHCCIVHSN